MVALTLHGNYFLQEANKPKSPDLLSLGNSFHFCEWVAFTELAVNGPVRNEVAYAANPTEWYERLRGEGTKSLRMLYGASGGTQVADRMMVGFVGGGGRWLIEASGPGQAGYWESRWKVGDRTRADRKIWQVTYVRILSTNNAVKRESEDLEKLKSELKQVLEEILDFARAQNVGGFTKAFESGLERLQSQTPLEGLYVKDVAPEGYLSLAAAQLLGAAQAAWVFGGMGSWNDMGFEGQIQVRYEKVSEKLYQTLNRAIIAAANSRSI
jgi:hypothetical protein